MYRDPLSLLDVLDDSGNVVTRVCRKCTVSKPIEDYHWVSGRRGRRRICKSCDYEAAVFRKKNSPPERNYSHIRRTYGIDKAGFIELVSLSGGKCMICDRELDLTTRTNQPNKLQIDHDHVTGKVRGILCFSCNTALGKMQDSPETLKKAARYLENPPDIPSRDRYLSAKEHGDAKRNNAKSRYTGDLFGPVPRTSSKRLTEKEAVSLVQEYATGTVSQGYLAAKYGITQASVAYQIKKRLYEAS